MSPRRLLRFRPIRAMWRFVFKPAARYPADPRAVFILALSVFSGLVALVVEAAPATLEALLPRWGVMLWGIMLFGGSAITLTGMLFQSLNGIITEQIGSVVVGVTTVFYATLAIVTLQGAAFQVIGIVLAWGLSCFIRWVQLQALINESYREGHRREIIKAVEDALHEDRES